MYNLLMRFLILPNPAKMSAQSFVRNLSEYLLRNNQEVFVIFEEHRYEGVKILTDNDDYDIAITLGGDGTLLRYVRSLKNLNKPYYGINFGHVGFLTTSSQDEVYDDLEKIIAGNYKVIERELLDIYVIKDGEEIANTFAINELSFYRGQSLSTLNFEMKINNQSGLIFRGDGVLCSTPTGSTAYNFTAGGPVVLPSCEAIVVKPICTDSQLLSHSIVISSKDVVTLKMLDNNRYGFITVDGVEEIKVDSSMEVEVKTYQDTLKTITFFDEGEIEIYRKKLTTM